MVKVANTLVAPYRCICRIVTHAYDKLENEYSIGTGFLISPYHVLTCAHVIYPRQAPHTGTIDVYPAQNGPDDNAVRFRANGWAVSPRWWTNDCRTADVDYGIIRLANPAQYGFFQLRPFDPAIMTSKTVHLAGYPGSARDPKAQYMYRSQGLVAGAYRVRRCIPNHYRPGKDYLEGSLVHPMPATARLILHDLDTLESQSGSPMWIEGGGLRTLIGIHERGLEDPKIGHKLGVAVLLNDAVRAQVARWMNTELPPLRRQTG
jgi:V8-like Glu-specific endopeptidase